MIFKIFINTFKIAAVLLPVNILHIIIGFISDMSFTTNLEIGGTIYGEPINIIANTPTFGLRDKNGNAWPIVDTQYHDIKLVNNIPKDAKVWSIGVRLPKDKLQYLEKSIVPEILAYKTGCIYPCVYPDINENENNYNVWSPL